MRLAIVGSGALGSLFAAVLSPHIELVMLGHWPEQLARLRSVGLTLVHPDGQRSTHHFAVSDDPSQIPAVGLALVLVKSYQTQRAALEIKAMLAADGLAVTLQNGLGNVAALAGVLGQDRVTQGVTAAGATMLEAGVVRFAGQGATHLALLPEKREAVQQLASLLQAAGFETHLTGDLNGLAWGKLAVNSGINPLTALLRVPNGVLASNDQARNLMCKAAEETVAVARALGIDLPYTDPSQRVLEVAQATAANRSSMLQDVLRGSQTEIDAICGAVARHGRKAGIPTPINDEFLRLILAMPQLQKGESLKSTLGALQALLEKRIGEVA